MKKENIFISTIAKDAKETAEKYGLGLEIAEYCTAWNMDEKFAETNDAVLEKTKKTDRLVLHAPFSELFPSAIDKEVRKIAAKRYRQAINIAEKYNAKKVIIHAGYNERLYYPVWFTEQSVVFWNEFFKDSFWKLKEKSGAEIEIVLENVLETEPEMLTDILKAVNHERLKMCLDIGHVNAYSKIPVEEWLEKCAEYISHFHIHNNDKSFDTHNALFDGSIEMEDFLKQADLLCHDATFTLEVLEALPSVEWMEKKGLI